MATSNAAPRTRRSQQERTAETRTALFNATVQVIYRLGYAGATTALIADEAGVSRGAILHHFGTRAELMAQVVQWVYDGELTDYFRQMSVKHVGGHIADWTELMWEMFNRPTGFAVLEILWATRSDVELAERVLPIQAEIEEASLAAVQKLFKSERNITLTMVRLTVWAVRGLTIERMLVNNPDDVGQALKLFVNLIRHASPNGTVAELERFLPPGLVAVK